MDKSKALQEFWELFGWDVYDMQTVPTGEQLPEMPYITYSSATDSFEKQLQLNASVWDKSMSWKNVEQKVAEVAETIGKNGYYITSVDGGYMTVKKGTPFAQRMMDEDDSVRRIIINVEVEFLTAW